MSISEFITHKEEAPPIGSLMGLGRLMSKDKRDRDFLLPRSTTPPKKTFRSWLTPGPVLDQGGTSQCVIYAGDLFLSAHRTVNKSFDPSTPNVSPIRTRIYKAVQGMDEWPGDAYDGTSVRALFKWLKLNGYIGEYRWAFDVPTITDHLLFRGPVVMGTSWSYDMFQPDRHGYIYFTGGIAGGHAYLIVAVNLNRKNPDGTIGAVRIQNSWSLRWGQKGRVWITLKDLAALVEDYGEAGVATEIKLAA